jgi:hypothetical protein
MNCQNPSRDSWGYATCTLQASPEGRKFFRVEVLNHREFHIAPTVGAAVLTHLEPLQHAVPMEPVPANGLLYNPGLRLIISNANTAGIVTGWIFLARKFGTELLFQYYVLIRV